MKKRVIVILVIAVLVLGACGKTAYTITDPYVYKVIPGMEEWDKMTAEEKVESCKVPVRQMKKMTTAALVETVMNYPLLNRLTAILRSQALRESFEEKYNYAFTEFSSEFAGIEVLKEREDGLQVLDSYVENKKNSLTEQEKDLARVIKNYISITKERP